MPTELKALLIGVWKVIRLNFLPLLSSGTHPTPKLCEWKKLGSVEALQ